MDTSDLDDTINAVFSADYDTVIDVFWDVKMKEAQDPLIVKVSKKEIETGSELPAPRLDTQIPLRVVKNFLMQNKTRDIGFTRESGVLFAKLVEYFVEEVTLKSWHLKPDKNTNTLEKKDIERALVRTEEYDFLVKNHLGEESLAESRQYDSSYYDLGQWKGRKRLLASLTEDETEPDVLEKALLETGSADLIEPDTSDLAKLEREEQLFNAFDLFPMDDELTSENNMFKFWMVTELASGSAQTTPNIFVEGTIKLGDLIIPRARGELQRTRIRPADGGKPSIVSLLAASRLEFTLTPQIGNTTLDRLFRKVDMDFSSIIKKGDDKILSVDGYILLNLYAPERLRVHVVILPVSPTGKVCKLSYIYECVPHYYEEEEENDDEENDEEEDEEDDEDEDEDESDGGNATGSEQSASESGNDSSEDTVAD